MQRKLRWMENKWWARKAAQIQSYANINDAKSFYEALKAVYRPSSFFLHRVRSTDGVLIKNKELILKRWAEYLQNLLNKVHTTDPGFLDDLPTLPTIPKFTTHHPLTKWKRPFSVSKTTKLPVLTTSLLRSLSMVAVLYTEGCIILSFTAGPLNVSHSNGKMPTLFLCTSKGVTELNVASRGISLLSVAGEVLAKIMLTRLLEHVVDLVLPESQCGFGAYAAQLI